jgi:putative transposase
MLAQSHFKFKMLLRYKMARVGGLLIDCEDEFTSKTCSWCGEINEDLGGSPLFQCPSCGIRLDRDIKAARNIFQKNKGMLAELTLACSNW